MNSKWSTDSWRDFPIKHQPVYSDINKLMPGNLLTVDLLAAIVL